MTIKEICEKYNIGQTALARRFNIPLRTVQDWHAGRRNPPEYLPQMIIELLEHDSITVYLFDCYDLVSGKQNCCFYGAGSNEAEALKNAKIPHNYEVNEIYNMSEEI